MKNIIQEKVFQFLKDFFWTFRSSQQDFKRFADSIIHLLSKINIFLLRQFHQHLMSSFLIKSQKQMSFRFKYFCYKEEGTCTENVET
jgi:hypothetical protein